MGRICPPPGPWFVHSSSRKWATVTSFVAVQKQTSQNCCWYTFAASIVFMVQAKVLREFSSNLLVVWIPNTGIVIGASLLEQQKRKEPNKTVLGHFQPKAFFETKVQFCVSMPFKRNCCWDKTKQQLWNCIRVATALLYVTAQMKCSPSHCWDLKCF